MKHRPGIRTFINKKYLNRINAAGRPGYGCILLLKMLLLQTCYRLNDFAFK
ncbi:hypothetical protein [Porphyromonas pogonae]|uniref:hypothetical protein n=1 Tax=Porphyromonas pogonae TaxID=867595 RepID=UPI002E77834E|nr:hypothetical protein [Porphyromonas pogonae]